MKTILRIIIILLVGSIVAGTFSLAVNNTSSTVSTNEAGAVPAVTGANGQTFQPMERPDGSDHDEGSLTGGLSGVLMTIAKLTGISVLVLLVQKAASLLGNRSLVLNRR